MTSECTFGCLPQENGIYVHRKPVNECLIYLALFKMFQTGCTDILQKRKAKILDWCKNNWTMNFKSL